MESLLLFLCMLGLAYRSDFILDFISLLLMEKINPTPKIKQFTDLLG